MRPLTLGLEHVIRFPSQPTCFEKHDSHGLQMKAAKIPWDAVKIYSAISKKTKVAQRKWQLAQGSGKNDFQLGPLTAKPRNVSHQGYGICRDGVMQGSEWWSPFGAYLRSRSEPFGEESERKAPGGGPLSWGDMEVKHFPDEEGTPQKATPPPHLATRSGGPQVVGGKESSCEMLILGVIREREQPPDSASSSLGTVN